MEMYNIIAGWASWPAIVALLLIAGAYARFIINNHLAFLKDRNKCLQDELIELRNRSPNIMELQLNERLEISHAELARLKSDHNASEKTIQEKEANLLAIKTQLSALQNQIKATQDFLLSISDYGLLCPRCGSPMETREYHSEMMEDDQGHDIEIDHQLIQYSCGYILLDGNVLSECAIKNTI